jgi:hypothetical protein
MREKNREASAASSLLASLAPFQSAVIAMTPRSGLRRAAFRAAIEDLYDVGGEAAVCAAQHFRAIFPIGDRGLGEGGALATVSDD